MAAKSTVLTSSSEIHERIQAELGKASQEVKVAVAWFTNQALLDALISASSRGCKIQLIIADNEDNNKLDFESLVKAGGQIQRVKSTGFGMMHQKYCIIDSRLAITGSFNWTNNALRNNSENAIFTEEPEIIQSLSENFESILKTTDENFVPTEKKAAGKVIRVESSEEAEFVDDLQRLTQTLVSEFDDQEVEAHGFAKAQEHKGESSIFPSLLTHTLNSLRNSLVQDKERRANYKKQLELLWEGRKSQIKDKYDRDHNALDKFRKQELEIIKEQKDQISEQVKLERGVVIELKELLSKAKMKLELLQEEIEELKQGIMVRPLSFKRVLPWAIALGFITTYLFIFYSAAIYTLQYVAIEAKKALAQGGNPPHVDFFNAKAIIKVWSKGFGAIMFTFLAVLIPLGLAAIKLYASNKFVKIFFGWIIAVLIVDAFVAFAISQTIFEVQLLSGKVTGEWSLKQAISSMDFYKVFIFGAIPLIMFKLLVEKLHDMWLNGSMDHVNKEGSHLLRIKKEAEISQKAQLERAQHNLELQEEKIKALKQKADELSLNIQQVEKDAELKQNDLTTEYQDRLNRNQRMMEIFQADLDGARTHLMEEAFKARAAILRTGWQRFLSSYFATEQVTLRVNEIEAVYSKWYEQNFPNN